MYNSILKKLKTIISDLVGDKNAEIQSLSETSDFVLELGMSSIDSLQLLSLIEIEFDIYIEDDELNSDLVSSLGNLCNFILRKTDPNSVIA